MKRTLAAALTAALTVSAMLLAGPAANAAGTYTHEDSNVEEILTAINESSAPWEELDSLPQHERELLVDPLSRLTESEVNSLFGEETAPTMSTFAASNYTDIVWSTLEKAYCVIKVDLISCNRAADDAAIASSSAKTYYPSATSLRNGKGDAYRHCYWNARMVHSIGMNGATKIGDLHEAANGGSANEKKMDLANNKTGRSIGSKYKLKSEIRVQCKSRADKGQLVTLR